MSDFDIDIDQGEIQVRLEELKEEWTNPPTYQVESGAEYSVSIEFGRGPVEAQSADALRFENEDGEIIYRTSVSGHPPYPFFRPAIREFRANPESFILDNTDYASLNDISSAEELVESVSFALEAQMKKNATASEGGRSPGTDPNHPQVKTGNLRARIVARRIQ